jgi:hypothetical protein
MQTPDGILTAVNDEIHLGWHRLRWWAERVFARQRIAEIAIITSTLTIIGVVLLCLIGAIQDRTITGPFPY